MLSSLPNSSFIDPAYSTTIYYPSSYPNYSIFKSRLSSLPSTTIIPVFTIKDSWKNILETRRTSLKELKKVPSSVISILLSFIDYDILPLSFTFPSLTKSNDIIKPTITLLCTKEKMSKIISAIENTSIKIVTDSFSIDSGERVVLTFALANFPGIWMESYVEYLFDENFYMNLLYPFIPLDLAPKSSNEMSVRPRTIDYYNHTTHLPN